MMGQRATWAVIGVLLTAVLVLATMLYRSGSGVPSTTELEKPVMMSEWQVAGKNKQTGLVIAETLAWKFKKGNDRCYLFIVANQRDGQSQWLPAVSCL